MEEEGVSSRKAAISPKTSSFLPKSLCRRRLDLQSLRSCQRAEIPAAGLKSPRPAGSGLLQHGVTRRHSIGLWLYIIALWQFWARRSCLQIKPQRSPAALHPGGRGKSRSEGHGLLCQQDNCLPCLPSVPTNFSARANVASAAGSQAIPLIAKGQGRGHDHGCGRAEA